jgi:hypothetical protein
MLFLSLTILVGALLVAVFMANTSLPEMGDAQLAAYTALPSSTTAVTSTAIDTGVRSANAIAPKIDLFLSAPALSTAQLPDGKTMTYTIIQSPNPDLSGYTPLNNSVIVQTGAGGAGAAGATARVSTPDVMSRYIGFTVTPAASGTGDASGTTATMQMLF